MKNILCIGGFDSTCGAGIIADYKTCCTLGINPYLITTSTAIQNQTKLFANYYRSTKEIKLSMQSIFEESEIEFIKIGMVGNEEIAKTIIDFLKNKNVKIILDTPLKTSSNGILQSKETILTLASNSFLATPNKEEFDILNYDTLPNNILVKSFFEGTDRLFNKKLKSYQDFVMPKIELNANVRGTGCSMASAICCFMFLGNTLEESCIKAKKLIHNGIKNAKFNGINYTLNFSNT